MICELILIGSVALNPCNVVGVYPDRILVNEGFLPKYKLVETGHCDVYLNNGSHSGLKFTIMGTPCSVVIRKINQQLKQGEDP